MSWKVIVTAILVLLSGCVGVASNDTPDNITSTKVTDKKTTDTKTNSNDDTPSSGLNISSDQKTQDTLEPPDNPFEQSNVTVAITGSPDYMNATREVRSALDYWESGEGNKYSDYDVNFILEPNASDARVTVEFKESIYCDYTITADNAGCASVLNNDTTADQTENVEIMSGYSNNSTQQILRHEFGHLYGLEHGEEPMPLMSEEMSLTRQNRPNASERRNGWESFDDFTVRYQLTIATNTSTIPDFRQDDVDEQVGEVIDYFNNDPNSKIPPSLTLTRSSTSTEADIEVRIGDTGDPDIASTQSVYGYDLDTDDAIEQYSKIVITIDPDVPTEHFGYHIAYPIQASFLGPNQEYSNELDGHDDDREDWYD